MQAYNKQLLYNTFLVAEARSLQTAGFINREQGNFIEGQLPTCQTQNNILVRTGMFLLGCILFSSCCGFFSLMSYTIISSHYAVMLLIYAAFGFVATELIAQQKKYFANGIDDAFLICAQLCLVIGIGLAIDDRTILTPIFLAMVLSGIICCIRYVDSFSAFFACVGITATIIDLMFKMDVLGKSLLPFVMMILAAGLWLLHAWLRDTLKANKLYARSLNVLYAFSLVLFYLAGNYLVVREGNVQLLHKEIQPGTDIQLAWLFYAFTIITPVAYVCVSLLRKDRIMLWVGMLSVAFSIFTIRYYYHIMPLEYALLAGAFILFVIAYFSIEKLKEKTTGLTYKPDRFTNTDEMLNAEAFVIIQSFGAKPAARTSSNNVTFGGGDFGGGGAGDTF